MVFSVVPERPLERVPGEFVAAVVVDGLERAEGEEGEAALLRHAGDFECESGAEGVHEEAFEGVVVECSEGVGAVEAVVVGVDCP